MALKRKSVRNRVLLALAFAGVVIGSCYGWYRHEYPYGSTHRCNKGIYFSLIEYADSHNGNFPQGEDSADALSKLVSELGLPENQWGQFAGKAFTDEEALRCVKEHGRLTEEFCSWHYVSGLRADSDPGLALFWDKTGLTHSGARTNPVRYEVTFVSGGSTFIPASKWESFLRRQEEIRKESGRSE